MKKIYGIKKEVEFYALKSELWCAFILNLIIFAFEIVGLILSLLRHGANAFVFYTEISNYLALIVSFVYCIFCIFCYFRKKEIPIWLISFRFITTVCLVITFIVSFFIIVPFRPSMFSYMLYEGSSLYHHLLCPLLSFVSFLLIEPQSKLPKYNLFFALLPTFVYGVIMVTLNLLKIIEGPYPFLYFYQVKWYLCTLILVGIVALCLAITALLRKFYNMIEHQTHFENTENKT